MEEITRVHILVLEEQNMLIEVDLRENL
jgi:hypothetical protein